MSESLKVPEAPTIPWNPRAVDRILACYLRSLHSLGAPSQWYARQQESLESVSDDLGICLSKVAAVASVLSPGTRWEQVTGNLWTIIQALQIRDGKGIPAGPFYRRNREKAVRAFRDGFAIFDAVKAPKTTRFAFNLIGEYSCVTIDRWAFRIAGLEYGGIGRYTVAESSFVEAARILGRAPAIVQATTWVGVRDCGVLIS